MNRPNDKSEPERNSPLWQAWKWPLHWQILLGLCLGAAVGFAIGAYSISLAADEKIQSPATWVKQAWFVQVFQLFGDLFLNALKMIVVPLILSSIGLAVAGIGGRGEFGRLGLKTIAYFLSSSLIAILIGLFLVNVVKPGATSSGQPMLTNEDAKSMNARLTDDERKKFESSQGEARKKTSFERLLDVFRSIVPSNPIKAAAEGDLLGTITIAVLIGFFLTRLSGPPREALQNILQGTYDLTLRITDFVMQLAPIGIACLLAATIAVNYARLAEQNLTGEFLISLIKFSLMTVVGLAIHMFIVLPLYLILFARINPIKHFQAMVPAMITAFSTSSSNATLPVNMECVEKRAGVSNKIASFVLPLGATVNMNGTALYECVSALFVAQMFGAEISPTQQFFVVVVALLTSIGVAGVPSASLVAILIILQSLSQQLDNKYPLEAGLAILLIFDRLLDMTRTTVNIFSDTVGAVIVARSEGETVAYPMQEASQG
jgi:proton glutamate symport protein